MRRLINIHKLSIKGDTLVEVMLATAVMATVLTTALVLANRATRINQQAYERTQVSLLLQQQAELLRAARNDAGMSAVWAQVLSSLNAFEVDSPCSTNPVISNLPAALGGRNPFYLTTPGGVITKTNGVSTPAVNGTPYFHFWIEGVSAGPNNADFIISGCWESLVDNVNQQTGIAIRLGT